MTNEEFKDKWLDDMLIEINDKIDSWRHEYRHESVFLDEETKKYWRANYRVSGDGEYHGIREDEFDILEVTPITKMIEITKYVSVK